MKTFQGKDLMLLCPSSWRSLLRAVVKLLPQLGKEHSSDEPPLGSDWRPFSESILGLLGATDEWEILWWRSRYFWLLNS